MTQILSLLTQSQVFQASDRRVTRVQAGKVIDFTDMTNKATIYLNRVAFAYTGAADIRGDRTDRWIAETLGPTRFLDDAFNALRDKATSSFATAEMSRRPRASRALAIVGAGWNEYPGEQFRPFIGVVSNFLEKDGRPGPVKDSFDHWGIEIGADMSFLLFVAGQPLPAQQLRTLRRIVAEYITRGLSAATGLRILTDAMRSAASANSLIGRDLMISCLPRSALKNGELLVLAGPPTDHSPTFAYAPAQSNDLEYYGANFAGAGTVMTDFQAFFGEEARRRGSRAGIDSIQKPDDPTGPKSR